MSGDARLAEIITALEGVGVSCLVMGGHAVRFYGLNRNTIDFDLHLAPACWGDLTERLAGTGLFKDSAPIEGPSWRPRVFRRFQIGQLADGREEWLEFWGHNHLLPPFNDLWSRREEGTYGGRVICFLALPDLIRSKETERANDWQDVAVLEEFLDARLIAHVAAGRTDLVSALRQLRSRRGLESHLQKGHLSQAGIVEQAIQQTTLSITIALLLPFVATVSSLPTAVVPIEPVILNRLRAVPPASALHLALVEVVRRQYKLACQIADRADKHTVDPR